MKKSYLLSSALVIIVGVIGYFLFNPSVWRSEPSLDDPGGGLRPPSDIVATDSNLRNIPQFQYPIASKTRSPQYLALADGELYVSYAGLNMIDLLDYRGVRIQMFDPLPQGRADIIGLGIDNAGKLYVADSTRKMILVFDHHQKFLYTFPPQGQGANPVNVGSSLSGLTVARGMIFINDREAGDIQVFLANGDFVYSISAGADLKDDSIWQPGDVVLAQDGRLVIADQAANKLSAFSCDGKFAYFFEGGPGEAKKNGLGEMAIDWLGRIHVIAAGLGKILVYDHYGHFLFSYGESESTRESLPHFKGIAIDLDKKLIFLADPANRRIETWGFPAP